MDTVLRLNPRGSVGRIIPLAMIDAYYFERDYVAALEVAERTVRAYPKFPPPHLYLAAALGQVGRFDEASVAMQRAIDIAPQQIDYYVRKRPPWYRVEDYEHTLDGLRKAGREG